MTSTSNQPPAVSWITKTVNFVLFQAAWFAAVIGAANGNALAGTLAIAVVIIYHLACAARWRDELSLVACALSIGLIWDSLMVSIGLIHYPSGMVASGWAPYWIVAMWGLFATTLNVSLGWLRGKPFLAMIFGAVGGPLSYWAGVRMGALAFDQPIATPAALSIGWALLTPLLVSLATRFDGITARESFASGQRVNA